MRGAAFFDLDRTLIPFNSGMRYALWERRAGRLSSFRILQSSVWLGLYHLAIVDMTRAFEKAVGLYKGIARTELEARTRAWFAVEIEHALVPGARQAMAEHRAAGRPLIILSSTSAYMATVATERWGFDGWIANDFPVDERGNLTGLVTLPVCYGPGKVDHARRWAEIHGVDLAASWFYSDSRSDLPMLEAVGTPVVVNPDPRLAFVARRRGWPVHRWG